MKMINKSSTLMRMCTENVYADNIFHVLGLPITATPKKVRRRREDVDAANKLGGDTWKREFKYLLGNRGLPSLEEVDSAFERLAEPEFRLLSEFFWFWPTDDADTSVEKIITGDRHQAIESWERDVRCIGEKRAIAQHNLAVIYQFYAIDAEQQMLDQMKIKPLYWRIPNGVSSSHGCVSIGRKRSCIGRRLSITMSFGIWS